MLVMLICPELNCRLPYWVAPMAADGEAEPALARYPVNIALVFTEVVPLDVVLILITCGE